MTGRATTVATPSTRRSSAPSAGRRRRRSPTVCGRRSSGTASTARGGSRSSPASSASTTSASTARGSALPRLLERVEHFLAAGLERLRALEVRHRAAALPELHERVAEVVVRVRLGEAALTVELLLCILQHRQRRRVLALLHQRPRAVVLGDGIASDG